MQQVTGLEFVPMNLTEGDITQIEEYIYDEDWVFQQKFDGMRVSFVYHDGDFRWVTRGGKPMKSAAALLHLPEIGKTLSRLCRVRRLDSLILDGEIVTHTGIFHVFDLAYLQAIQSNSGLVPIRNNTTFNWRETQLWSLLKDHHLENVERVRTPTTVAGKREMFQAAKEAGVEGIVAKRSKSEYVQGARSKDQLKFKFVQTADVVVISRTESPNSATVAVFDSEAQAEDEELIAVGRVNMNGKGEVHPGDVIEVAYLYFQEAMVQPRMIRKRTDKQEHECLLNQFPTYSREVI